MKSKVFFWLFLLSLAFQNLSAQYVKWMPFKKNESKKSQTVVGLDAKGLFVYSENYRDKYLKKYNFQLAPLWEKQLPLEDKNIVVEDVTITKKHNFIFFSIYNYSGKKHGLFCQKVNQQDRSIQQPITIFDQRDIGWKNRSDFKIFSSRDLKTFIAIHYNNSIRDQKHLSIRFLDERLIEKNKTTFSLSDDEIKYQIKKTILGEDGNLYLLIYVEDTDKKLTDPARYFYKIVQINSTNGLSQDISLKSSEYILNALSLDFDKKNNQLVLGGFYSEESRKSIKGSLLVQVSIDSSLEIKNVGFDKFGTEFLTRLIGSKNAKKERELTSYKIKHLIIRSDGGAVLIAESTYETTQTYVQYNINYPTQRNITYYHYDEIIVLSINPDGKKDWEQIIPKSQVSRDRQDLGSFILMRLSDKLSFVFNEDLNYNANILEYSIDNYGNIKPNTLVGKDLSDLFLQTIYAKQLSSKTIIVPASKRKRKGILKITY